MVANKAYKFRLYPNRGQEEYLAKAFGSVRFVYNHMLAERKSLYEQYKDDKEALKAHRPKTYSDWKKEYPWLYDIDNLALANAQIQLNAAYKNFFRDKSFGFPKFRSKKSGKNSYMTNNQGSTIRVEDGRIRLPKTGWVSIKAHREIPSGYRIKSVTISRNPSGRYYASILTEYDFEPPVIDLDPAKSIGLDYSSPHFYVDSDGEIADMPHWFRIAETKLAREQRKLSRMMRGSSNYLKQKVKVARTHEHVSNQRKDWMEKKSTEIANKYDIISIENINLRGVAGALKLGKSTNDNGFGMFRNRLSCKFGERGKKLIIVDKWFPSSKTCHICGYRNNDLTLSTRSWTCPICGAEHDRDLNAAINIREEGLKYA